MILIIQKQGIKMKNIVKCLLVLSILNGRVAVAGEIATKKLPAPNIKKGFLSVLAKRKSTRSFNPKGEISDEILGEILWAAFGVSHDGGKKTIPTAMDAQDLTIYAVKKDGVWKYVPETHSVIKITDENLNKLFNKQSYVDDAQAILVYTTESDNNYAYEHAGSSYQNVAVYCAEKGINNVVRGYFDADGFKKVLKLGKKTKVIISQVIGY
jgi:nitroreductase